MKIKPIDEDLDYDMYELINNTLKENGYHHYEISNYAKKGYESKHNMVYWHNKEYYGFGLGAAGYIDNIRYENTKSLNKYLSGAYLKDKHTLSLDEVISNEFILGFRLIDGIKKEDFYLKYHKNILENEMVKKLLNERKLLQNNEYIYINPKYIYVSNDILINFI